MFLVARNNSLYRVHFHFERDRFLHRIEHFDGSTWIGLWESVEGDDLQEWPSSPTLQEVTDHQGPDGQVFLGLGKAGQSYWSIVVESPSDSSSTASPTSASSNQPQVLFRFDVACRLGASVGALGSTYRSLVPTASIQNWQIESSGGGDVPVAQITSVASTDSQVDTWRCDATQGAAPGITRRWVYRWVA